MNSTTQESKIIPYKKRRTVNVGIIIFSIILLYLIINIVTFLTVPHVTVYEVRQGSIIKDNAYTGLALREETVFYADADGYGNYYIENNSKVRVGAEMFAILHSPFQYEQKDSDIILTDDQLQQLLLKIQTFSNNFKENDYESVYLFKQDIKGSLDKYTNQSMSKQLKESIAKNPSLVITHSDAVANGIVVYYVDGMEDVTLQDITSEHFRREDYKRTEFTNNSPVLAGKPIYKIVTEEKWQILFEISEETKTALEGKKTVRIRFKKDNQIVRGNISFLEDQPTVACITFDNSMIRYINDRYLDVELILEDQSGLKIPKSAETTKKFYIVPKTYLTQGGNSSREGVLLKSKDSNGNDITQFLAVTVYFEEDGHVYLDPNIFEKSTTLLRPDSTETYELSQMKSLKGVYCINKGYAVFRQIKVLCESDEYYIVEEGNQFGLSNYDHIALDSSTVRENDVVF